MNLGAHATGLALLLAAAEPAPPPTPVATHAYATGLTVLTRDYPREARERGEAGRVAVRYRVDAAGKVDACEIVETSGSTALDARSCDIARRGRYRPARDARGAAVAEYWRWTVDWRTPATPSIVVGELRPEGVAYAEAEPPLAVGSANWDSMPDLRVGGTVRQDARRLNDAVSSIFASRKCSLGAASADRYQLEVRYALRLAPDGRVERLLVEDKGCRPLELLVASMALDSDFLRAIEAPGGSEPRWYAARARFSARSGE